MDRQQAVEVAQRWLKHCDKVRDRSERLQLLAKDVRAGKLTADETRRVRNAIDGDPLIFDGARLERAVRVLVQNQSTKTE